MAQKISKKTRALAIKGLELAASNHNPNISDLQNVRKLLDEDSVAFRLAQDAWVESPSDEFGPVMLQEAADLLFDGWSPGEDLVKYRAKGKE